MPSYHLTMGDFIYLLGQLPVPWWSVVLGLLALLAVAVVAGRWYRRREDRESLYSEVDGWLRNLWNPE